MARRPRSLARELAKREAAGLPPRPLKTDAEKVADQRANDLRVEFDRSRSAPIVLGLASAGTLFELALLAANPDYGELGDLPPTEMLMVYIWVGVHFALSSSMCVISALTRSPWSILIGFIPFVMTWFVYVVSWLGGELVFSGLPLNIIGPVYMVRAYLAARAYKRLKKEEQIDVSTFA